MDYVLSELQEALEQFGRRARKLSVARLLEHDEILVKLGTDPQLRHPQSRQELAARIEHELRGVVAAITDTVDRRIAQAALATEPEFYDKYVGERRQYVVEHDLAFTDEQYKNRRQRILGDVAEALAKRMPRGDDPAVDAAVEEENPVEDSSTSRDDGSTRDQRPNAGAKRRRTRRMVLLAAAASSVIVFVAGVVAVRRFPAHSEQTWNGMTAAQLEARYDGKDPWGHDGDDSRCADPPPSQVVPGATTPPVMGPDGPQVGVLQLRMSPTCPTVVWARLLWNGDERATYRIPAGWTVHVVVHRPVTNTAIDESEPAGASAVPYAISDMITSARGCVYAEAVFTTANGSSTAKVPTSCTHV